MEPSPIPGCPQCGGQGLLTMEQLRDLVSRSSNEFSPDLAEWLSSPQRPVRPISRRHRTGLRNSVAFAVVWVLVFSAAYFALMAALPGPLLFGGVVAVGVMLAVSNWRTEFSLATKEDNLLLGAHWERYRAYLQRRRIWNRLVFCRKCALVVDPFTHRTSSLYEVHELTNCKVGNVHYKGVERRKRPRRKKPRMGGVRNPNLGI